MAHGLVHLAVAVGVDPVRGVFGVPVAVDQVDPPGVDASGEVGMGRVDARIQDGDRPARSAAETPGLAGADALEHQLVGVRRLPLLAVGEAHGALAPLRLRVLDQEVRFRGLHQEPGGHFRNEIRGHPTVRTAHEERPPVARRRDDIGVVCRVQFIGSNAWGKAHDHFGRVIQLEGRRGLVGSLTLLGRGLVQRQRASGR